MNARSPSAVAATTATIRGTKTCVIGVVQNLVRIWIAN
jgi:hypothetical protein